MIQNFKLLEKINLTQNVFEMIFEGEKELEMKPGQFITFLLEKIGGRAYSILEIDGNKIKLIIKKRELEEGGRGGSKLICEIGIGDSLKGLGPAGHFLLKDNSDNKLFIGTGTGIVPLFNMINYSLRNKKETKIHLVFGVREQEDIFYIDELQKIKENNPLFSYNIYVSRVKDLHAYKLDHSENIINSGYTTNFLTKSNIQDYTEAYICGAPMMIESSVEKLKKLNFDSEKIYFEKY